jgi:hypothetical protein
MKKLKKTTFLLSLLVLMTNFSFSQDLITKKNGDDFKAKVIEVTTAEIKYKKVDNLNGPLFTILKADVLSIKYENGTKDIFSEVQSTQEKNISFDADMKLKGKEDAINNYKGNNSGAAWTVGTTVLFSPLIGVIPAAVCSSSEPEEDNLMVKNPELMKNPTYNQAYKEQAHKTKKKKIWKNFGIGSAAWLLLVLVLGAAG